MISAVKLIFNILIIILTITLALWGNIVSYILYILLILILGKHLIKNLSIYKSSYLTAIVFILIITTTVNHERIASATFGDTCAYDSSCNICESCPGGGSYYQNFSALSDSANVSTISSWSESTSNGCSYTGSSGMLDAKNPGGTRTSADYAMWTLPENLNGNNIEIHFNLQPSSSNAPDLFIAGSDNGYTTNGAFYFVFNNSALYYKTSSGTMEKATDVSPSNMNYYRIILNTGTKELTFYFCESGTCTAKLSNVPWTNTAQSGLQYFIIGNQKDSTLAGDSYLDNLYIEGNSTCGYVSDNTQDTTNGCYESTGCSALSGNYCYCNGAGSCLTSNGGNCTLGTQCLSTFCDNATVSTIASDFWCFTQTGTNNILDSQDNDCEWSANESISKQCDEYPQNSCPNEQNYCNSSCDYISRDSSEAACTASTNGCTAYTWITSANACCGNNGPNEYFEDPGTGNTCCYKGQALANGSSNGAMLCYNGELYDCNNNTGITTATVITSCNEASSSGMYCSASNVWNSGIPLGCTGCEVNNDCSNSTNGTFCDGEDGTYMPLEGSTHDNHACYMCTLCPGDAQVCSTYDNTCQYQCGSAANCDDYAPNSCITTGSGIGTYCDANCGEKSRDYNESICLQGTNDCTAYHWISSGETSAFGNYTAFGQTSCCGNNNNENFINSSLAGTYHSACCSASTDCVNSTGYCITNGTTQGEYTCNSGIWTNIPKLNTVSAEQKNALNSMLGSISLSWSGTLPTGYSYYLEQTDPSVSEAYYGTATSLTINNLNDNTLYCYQLRAQNAETNPSEYTAWSNNICNITRDRTGPKTPKMTLTAYDNSSNEIKINTSESDSGLVLYMPFEAGSGTTAYDQSPYHNNGQLEGGVSWVPGKYGDALSFDGSSGYVNISSISGLKNTYTISLWFDASKSTHMWSNLVSSQSFRLSIDTNQNFAFGLTNGTTYSHIYSTDYSQLLGKWNHISVVNNNGNITLYLNGIQVGSGEISYSRAITGITIGADMLSGIGGSDYMTGSIDEVRIYNRSLTQKEIINNMQSGLIRHGLYRSNTSSGTYEPVGGLWDNFSTITNWNLVSGATISGGKLTCTNTNDNPTSTVNSYSGNRIIETDFNRTAGERINLVAKYVDASNFIRVFYYAGAWRWQTRIGGSWSSHYSTTSWTINNNQIYHAKIICDGNNYKLYLNDVFVNEYTNSDFTASTYKVGLDTDNSTVEYDNVKVTPLIADNNYTDTDAKDVSAPDTPNAPTVAPISSSQLSVSWPGVSDNGDDYFYYIKAFDDEGNENNLISNGYIEKGTLGSTVPDWESNLKLNDTHAYSGSKSGLIVKSDTGELTSAHAAVDIPDNTIQYRYGGCVYSDGPSADIFFFSSNTTNFYDGTYDNITTTEINKWVCIEGTSTNVVNTDNYITLRVDNNGGGKVWFDNLFIYPIKNTTITTGIKDYYITGTGADAYSASSPFTVSGLTPNTQYCYTVKAQDNALNLGNASSQICNYTYAEQPNITSVTCGGKSPNYFCNVSYTMGSNPSGTEHYINETSGNSGGADQTWTTSTSVYDNTGLTAHETYCYKIKARNSNNIETSYSSQSCGTVTDNPPTVPILIYPHNNSLAFVRTPKFTWNQSTDPDGDTVTYQIEITETSCSNTSYCTGYDTRTVNITTPDYQITSPLQAAATYQWKVRAYDGTAYSSWSLPFTLTTNQIPTQETPILKASDNPLNKTTASLYCYNESTYDADGDTVYNIYNWYNNSNAIDVLNMPLDKNVSVTTVGAITDYSPYGNNGTLGGGNSLYAPVYESGSNCQIGGCYNFDGSNYIKITNSQSLEISNKITLEAWVYPRSIGTYSYIMSNDRDCCGSYKGYSLALGYTGFNIWDQDEKDHSITLTSSPTLNQWHLITGVYDGSQMKIYIDGKLNNTLNWVGTIGTPPSFNLAIGNLGSGPTGPYGLNGSIDNVKIYKVPLTSSQILQDYNAGLAHHQDSVLNSSMTQKGETWKCSVSPDDLKDNGTTKSSNTVTIENTPPTVPILVSPADSNITTSRLPTFTWQQSTDPDGDTVTYQIEITETSCSDSNYCTGTDTRTTTISQDSYTPSTVLEAATYQWKVRAYDGTAYSSWSSTYTLTVEPMASLSLVYSSSDFGSMLLNETKDTTSASPGASGGPIVIKNNGNIYEDITTYATSLWSSEPLSTSYYQYEAGQYPGMSGAYNSATSASSWLNMSSSYQILFDSLNWTTNKNQAEMNLKLTVPKYETPGTKQSTIYLRAQAK